ncbi:MAG: hypothetical protein NDJ89_12080 [Oligoflexia bacterium]|nr:hypothetical protein [Oligoflexia bacterium]
MIKFPRALPIVLISAFFLGALPLSASAQAKKAHPAIEPAASGEDWKGAPEEARFGAGLLTGLGLVDATAGFGVLIAGSHNVMPEGFIPDINDAGWAELVLGPTFLSGSNAFFYSTHLRWDFVRNADWSFYSLGGIAGYITDSALGNSFEIFPRLAAGAFWKLSQSVHLRGEISHEVIGLGVNFPL